MIKKKKEELFRIIEVKRGKKKTFTKYCANICHLPTDCVFIMDLYIII